MSDNTLLSPWLKAAWLGTAQSAAVTPPPGPLNALLQGVMGSPEQRLLAAAAATALAQALAGELPHGLPALNPAADDVRPLCPAAARVCLQRLLEDAHLRQLLPDWLQHCQCQGWQVAPADLPLLLNTCRHQPDWQATLLPVLGPRGQWLASQNPSWRYVYDASQPLETLWPEASSHLRLQLIRQHFQTEAEAETEPDPEAESLRSCLQSTWALEKAEHRAEQLLALVSGLSLADEPLLEQALEDRSKKVRETAQALLARLPGSAFSARMQARAEVALSLQAGKLELQLPKAEQLDAACLRDGLSLPNQVTPSARAELLYLMLRAVPPAHWLQHWQSDLPTLHQAFTQSRWKEPLSRGWYEALTYLGQETELLALMFPLQTCQLAPHRLAPLLQQVSWPQQTRYLREALQAWELGTGKPDLSELFSLGCWQRPWEAELTQQVCQWLAHLPEWLERDRGTYEPLLTAVVASLVFWGEPVTLRAFLPTWLGWQSWLLEAPVSESLQSFPEWIKFRIEMLEVG